MNYHQFTYSLIRAESGTNNTKPIAATQPYLEVDPQMESSSCCCCCCCCQNSLCCQCMCHSGMCCQGNCQLTPTTLPTVNIQEHAVVDELNPPKTTRHVRRDKSSIQIKPNAIDTNTRLNIKLKGSQSSHNIFKNNNLSSYNRDTYTTYNRQERHPHLSPSIENEHCNNDNASLPNVAVPPLNAHSEGVKHRSKSFVNVVNTTSSKYDVVYNSNNNNDNNQVDGDKQRHHSKNNRNSNDKIKYDLENFNQELLALKRKLANGKKSIPKYPVSSVKVTTSNSNNTLSNEAPNESVPKHSNYNNLHMYYPKDNTVSVIYTKEKDNTRNNNNNIDNIKGKQINNSFRGNTNKNQIPNGHCVIPVNKPKSKHNNNKTQHFSFTIFGENLSDTNVNQLQRINDEKDLIIDELNQKINTLTCQLNNLNRKYKDKISSLQQELVSKTKLIDKQNGDIQGLQKELHNIKQQQQQQMQQQQQHKQQFMLHKPSSLFIKASYDIPHSKRTVTTTTTFENTKTKKTIMSSSSSTSKLLNKLQLNTDLTLSTSSSKYHKQKPISDQLIFKNLAQAQSIICFDFLTKAFHFFNYADFNNFDINNTNKPTTEGALFLTHNSLLYMITGSNYDMLYSYTFKTNSINKLCQLSNNHHFGAFTSINDDELLCAGGSHNKKVEVYSIHKNEWKELPELNIERSEFALCVVNNTYIYALFGYNAVTKEYLNTIECLDLSLRGNEQCKWKYLKYKNEEMISMFIKGHIAGVFGERIIVVGGVNGNDNAPEENFIVISFDSNDERDDNDDDRKYKELKVEKVERKVKDIYKNSAYMFGTSFSEIHDDNGREFMLAFDDDNHVHCIQKGNLGHDVYYAEQ